MGSRHFTAAAMIAAALLCAGAAAAQTTVTIGIGTQDTTTNTVTTGTIIRELKLFEKHLPKDGKYATIKFQLDWNNFTSGPPVTNGMMANKLQIGMMGDYPLVVNGFTFQSNPESKSQLIATANERAARSQPNSASSGTIKTPARVRRPAVRSGSNVSRPPPSGSPGPVSQLRVGSWVM